MTSTHTGDVDIATLTDEVIRSFDGTPNVRTKAIVTALVRHLHNFVREIEPSLPEWETAIEFLTAVGKKCDPVRQEFVLLSDVLGVSMLVETINDQQAPGATDSTVLGPFHMTESPARQLGDTIDEVGAPQHLLVTGTVRSTQGEPLPHATVDVWQCNEEGFYDVQQPDLQPAGNGRGLFTTDQQGRFWFRTVTPSHYPIPTDGPVGELLHATGRHPYRPAHIHFIAAAPQHRPLTTHIFMPGSPYLDSDAVFAVKHSLVGDMGTADAEHAAQFGVEIGSPLATVDLVLAPAAPGGTDAP
ncbi:hydroxyquinol 1,2-dioxygenase (plasmid) [Rhodococcus jostii RHA1]|uniref:Hydroxyquinol 1,2-dioxygenase n=1 Tax=Rhodococcus jostii (strain RHA1) TaxID=101510 RepID=Q0RUS9_RHOJR|nr:dioxygenase [Rhodococcus jostii]ABH00957.1 hydroxyquinol 1,2-dioxygenase [Rhodococcus jostii RHA1]